MSVAAESGVTPLRRILDQACSDEGASAKDLTVLGTQNDPFRCDTPAGHRDGEWLAVHLAELGFDGSPIHLRGLHYALIGHEPTPIKPNGSPYRNTEEDWLWLQGRRRRPRDGWDTSRSSRFGTRGTQSR